MKKKGYKNLNRKQLVNTMKQMQHDLRLLVGQIDPPFESGDYAIAATAAHQAMGSLERLDKNDEGRRSVLVPILLYDGLLTYSLAKLRNTAKAPLIIQPFLDVLVPADGDPDRSYYESH